MIVAPTYWLIGLDSLAALGLGVLSVQDWRTRSVDLLLFPYLGLLFLIRRALTDPWEMIAGTTAVNFLVVISVTAISVLYLRVRFNAKINNTFEYMGLGDILFWLLSGIYFSDAEFCIYFVGSLLFALLGFMVIGLMKRNHSRLVPLAGLQAAYLIIWMVGGWFFPESKAVLQNWFLVS